MGMLVDGAWQRDDGRRTNRRGDFDRPTSTFRSWINGEDGFPAEAGRYHLFVNAGCPWAYRTILYRSLKGLESVVGISFTRPAAGEEGWTFGEQAEPTLGVRHVHELYSRADASFTGRATVPVLWDLDQNTMVNNESADIIRMFNSVFDSLPEVSSEDYYPDHLADEIDALNGRIYADVNNGVYRCGFAQSQEAYDVAFTRLFDTMDDLDERLSRQRFLCGDVVTEADWRLFATLVRFDVAYHGLFRCNRKRLADYPSLWPYARDLYQHQGVAQTVDVDAIKGIYYGSRPPGILPGGPEVDFDEPHGRG